MSPASYKAARSAPTSALRDTTLPTDQAELDELAQNTGEPLRHQGLTLFTEPDGNTAGDDAPPPAQNGYVGFAGYHSGQSGGAATILRWCATADSPAAEHAAGVAGLHRHYQRVLNYTWCGKQSRVLQPPRSAGLGPAGNLNAPYVSPPTLGQLASTMVAAQSQDSAATTSQLATEQAVQTTLGSKLSSQSGVNMDTEMSNMIQLQNAYGANAKVIAAVQSMWTQLLNSVQ